MVMTELVMVMTELVMVMTELVMATTELVMAMTELVMVTELVMAIPTQVLAPYPPQLLRQCLLVLCFQTDHLLQVVVMVMVIELVMAMTELVMVTTELVMAIELVMVILTQVLAPYPPQCLRQCLLDLCFQTDHQFLQVVVMVMTESV
jgi:hypothetical protein